jgi:hypothetical protein
MHYLRQRAPEAQVGVLKSKRSYDYSLNSIRYGTPRGCAESVPEQGTCHTIRLSIAYPGGAKCAAGKFGCMTGARSAVVLLRRCGIASDSSVISGRGIARHPARNVSQALANADLADRFGVFDHGAEPGRAYDCS